MESLRSIEYCYPSQVVIDIMISYLNGNYNSKFLINLANPKTVMLLVIKKHYLKAFAYLIKILSRLIYKLRIKPKAKELKETCILVMHKPNSTSFYFSVLN